MKQRNKELEADLEHKDLQIKELTYRISDLASTSPKSPTSRLSRKSSVQPGSEIDFLKKLAKVREEEISELKQHNRRITKKSETLLTKLDKYRKIIIYAKELNDQFINKLTTLSLSNNKHTHSHFTKVSLQNARFEFIRAKSESKSATGLGFSPRFTHR